MLRNLLLTYASEHPNLETGVFINGVFVPVDNVRGHGDPAVIELILDPDQLFKALSPKSPDRQRAGEVEPGPEPPGSPQ